MYLACNFYFLAIFSRAHTNTHTPFSPFFNRHSFVFVGVCVVGVVIVVVVVVVVVVGWKCVSCCVVVAIVMSIESIVVAYNFRFISFLSGAGYGNRFLDGWEREGIKEKYPSNCTQSIALQTPCRVLFTSSDSYFMNTHFFFVFAHAPENQKLWKYNQLQVQQPQQHTKRKMTYQSENDFKLCCNCGIAHCKLDEHISFACFSRYHKPPPPHTRSAVTCENRLAFLIAVTYIFISQFLHNPSRKREKNEWQQQQNPTYNVWGTTPYNMTDEKSTTRKCIVISTHSISY